MTVFPLNEPEEDLAKQVIEACHVLKKPVAPWREERNAPSDKTERGQSDKTERNGPTILRYGPAEIAAIMARAEALYKNVFKREMTDTTRRSYLKEFARMRADKNFDPLRQGDSKDTYYVRRAALHTVGARILVTLCFRCQEAAERKDVALVKKWAARLLAMVERLEPAFERDPPAPPDARPSDLPASRWGLSDATKPRRGKNSKKHVLKRLPKDWDGRLWDAAEESWPYRDALAVHLIVPVRPEELAPASRSVVLTLRADHHLDIEFAPAKSHHGRFGTGRTTISVNPTELGKPAEYLAQRCEDGGGRVIVSYPATKDAVRKAIAALGRKALPKTKIVITPYVCRHQVVADLKVTFGGGETVAVAAGHSTDKTQSKYGYIQNGRKRKGYLSITAARKPRVGNVERAHQLATRAKLKESLLEEETVFRREIPR